jgi:hypothetical protein
MLLPGHSRPRVLGVFAHPDDECFCAGGTLASYVAAGAETMVVSATRGEAGQIRDPQAATRRTLGQVRAGELALACRRLGVQHTVCLDYGDGRLKEVDQRVLTGEVAQIMRTFRPDVVLTFGEAAPMGTPTISPSAGPPRRPASWPAMPRASPNSSPPVWVPTGPRASTIAGFRATACCSPTIWCSGW